MEKVLIITGGSKGIGNGIVEEYKSHKYRVFSIARTKNKNKKFDKVEQIQFDLSNTKNIGDILFDIFKLLSKENIEKITLINNAATVGNIGRFENNSVKDIERITQLNIIAPLLLTSLFLKLTETWKCDKKIINISSGVATKPYYGLTTYCSTKAAIDMMTKSIALEQKNAENETKIIAIYPGVVDTEMQAEIRNTDKSNFADVEKFRNYKNSGYLTDKTEIGTKIYAIDHDETHENGATIDIDKRRFFSQSYLTKKSSRLA